MARTLTKTNTPGIIFRRHAKDCSGGRCECAYVAIWRHNGAQRKRTFSTLVEAREGLAAGRRAAKLAKGHAAGLHRDEPRAAARTASGSWSNGRNERQPSTRTPANGSSAIRAPAAGGSARRPVTTTAGTSSGTSCATSPTLSGSAS